MELGILPGPAPEEDRPVTRLEAAHVAALITDFPGTANHAVDISTIYSDWSEVPEPSRDAVYWVTVQRRLFADIPGGAFRPGDPLTLGEAAVILQILREF